MVLPATRPRILEAVARLGYVPHGAARALASRRSRTIGAVVPPPMTIHLRVADIGRIAAERMLARIGGSEVPKSHEIPVHLMVRASTAPPG